MAGALWMVLAAVSFGLMGVFVKLGAATLDTVALVFWRTLFAVLLLGGVALLRRQRFATPQLGRHLKRGLIGYTSLLAYFYAISHLPLSTAVTLNYTSPMFLALLSVLLLKEKLSRPALLALLLGFVGVTLLLRPTFDGAAWQAGLLGLSSGLLAGWSYLHVRELGQAGEAEWRTVFYFALISTLGGGLLLLGRPWQPLTADNLPWVLGLGATATVAQLAMTRAYKVGRKLLVANLSYLTVVFSALFGALVWQQQLGAGELLAMALIIVSGILAGRR